MRKLLGAASIGLLASLAGFAAPAHASGGNWPCEVALCMANPGGATQYPACLPPITRLWSWLADPFHSFPVCSMVGGEGVQTYGMSIAYSPQTGAVLSNRAWLVNLHGTNPVLIYQQNNNYRIISNFDGSIFNFRPGGVGNVP